VGFGAQHVNEGHLVRSRLVARRDGHVGIDRREHRLTHRFDRLDRALGAIELGGRRDVCTRNVQQCRELQ
jgi:hypothetical protein